MLTHSGQTLGISVDQKEMSYTIKHLVDWFWRNCKERRTDLKSIWRRTDIQRQEDKRFRKWSFVNLNI